MGRETTVRRRRGALVTVVGVLTALTTVLASPARAGVGITVVPAFPPTVAVGQQFSAVLSIGNISTPPDIQPEAVSDIVLVPGCTNTVDNCAGGVDPGVFSLAAQGVGAGACTGTSFTITQTSPGVFAFVPSAPLSIGISTTCTINF